MENLLAARHYLKSKPFHCTMESGELSNFFTVSTNEVKSFNSIIKGDPIIFALAKGSDFDIKGGVIVTAKKGNILIAPDKEFLLAKERREAERYPVSFYGYLKCHSSNKSEAIYIKDMSYCGYRFLTSADLDVGENAEIGVFFQHNVYSLEVIVMRKGITFGKKEYGVKATFRTTESIFAAQVQTNNVLKYERELFYKCLFNSTSKN